MVNQLNARHELKSPTNIVANNALLYISIHKANISRNKHQTYTQIRLWHIILKRIRDSVNINRKLRTSITVIE